MKVSTEPGQLQSGIRLGDRVLLGPLDWDMVDRITAMSQEQVGAGFRLDIDCCWAGDRLGFKADPSAYDNTPPENGISVVAVVIDAVGAVAAVRAREQVEALLGAMWLVDQEERDRRTRPPWIVGRPTMVESPRAPGFDEDSDLPLVVAQVSTRDRRSVYINFDYPRSMIDVAASVTTRLKLFDLIAKAETVRRCPTSPTCAPRVPLPEPGTTHTRGPVVAMDHRPGPE